MVWGGISHRAKTDLVTVHGNLNAMRYCNEIVQPALLPFLRQGHATIFQQDNPRCHVARHTMNFLQTNNVNVLDHRIFRQSNTSGIILEEELEREKRQ